ncbi:MAG: hypothetical protein HY539_02805 [Deltaproteobacteria bacterium]|nr:hypothetical protein [Deltaproteobacteria bacterium]
MIRLPTRLLHQIQSKASATDIPYQAFVTALKKRP